MYICVKLFLRNLNSGPYPPHPTSIYICEVTTALKVRGGANMCIKHKEQCHKQFIFPPICYN